MRAARAAAGAAIGGGAQRVMRPRTDRPTRASLEARARPLGSWPDGQAAPARPAPRFRGAPPCCSPRARPDRRLRRLRPLAVEGRRLRHVLDQRPRRLSQRPGGRARGTGSAGSRLPGGSNASSATRARSRGEPTCAACSGRARASDGPRPPARRGLAHASSRSGYSHPPRARRQRPLPLMELVLRLPAGPPARRAVVLVPARSAPARMWRSGCSGPPSLATCASGPLTCLTAGRCSGTGPSRTTTTTCGP